MKLVSWNVNGLRSCLTKGFLEYVKNEDPDILCLQETKLQPEQAVFDLEGYHRYFHSADKKGYSGTAVLTKEEPLSVTYGFGEDIHRHEGRVITAEYPDFYLVCCYTPNSQDGLKRLPYRMQWEDDLRAYLLELDGKKPVVYCGDLNVAHQEMDLKNPKTNRQNPGFSDEERAKMTRRLCRHLPHPSPGGDHLLLVELPLPRAGEERRLAHRLLHRVPAAAALRDGRRHPHGGLRQRPLPRGPAAGHLLRAGVSAARPPACRCRQKINRISCKKVLQNGEKCHLRRF